MKIVADLPDKFIFGMIPEGKTVIGCEYVDAEEFVKELRRIAYEVQKHVVDKIVVAKARSRRTPRPTKNVDRHGA